MARPQFRPRWSTLECASARNDVSPHTELALIAISTRERRRDRVDDAAELANRVDLDELEGYVIQQRLTLVVPARLKELGLAYLAGAVEERVSTGREQALASAKIQWLLTDGLLRRLEDVGIPALTVKGVDLSSRLYGDSAGRESRDIDLLVFPRDLERAVTIAQQEFGYAPPADAVGTDGRPLLHYRLEHPNGWPSLELHWRVHWYESAFGAEILRQSSMMAGRRTMIPSHELASLLLFYARDGFVGIRDLAAIAAWWDCYGSDLPRSGLAEFVREFPELALALATSATVAARLAGLPLAPLGLDGRRAMFRERRAAQLADPQPGSDISRLLADMALVDLLLAPALDLKQFVRRQLLLDASYNKAVRVVTGGYGARRRRSIGGRMLARAARMASGLATGRPTGLEVGAESHHTDVALPSADTLLTLR